ncbi:NUDIX domain-containing protein [Streptomyces lydicus]|uniref:NUDIX domain-containing protein n=1 Tax=Streptomyces lydicus TaxID=47763 RepID=UPI0037AECCB1
MEVREPSNHRGRRIVDACLVLIRDGPVLLGKSHPHCAFAPSTWHLAASHREEMESAVSRMAREAKEETGIAFTKNDLSLVHVIDVLDPALEAMSHGPLYTSIVLDLKPLPAKPANPARVVGRSAASLRPALPGKDVLPPMFTSQDDWDRSYADGRRYRQLSDSERTLLTTHVPAPDTGRALDIGCGAGELAAHLTGLGYAVDAVDWSETALADARTRHGEAARWLRLDVEGDDWEPLHADGYDLITLRFVAAFLNARDRTLHALGQRLRPGGALVVITPLAADSPAERRDFALDEDELAALHNRWHSAERHNAEGMACLILRGPYRSHSTAQDTAPDAGTQAALSSSRSGEAIVTASPREHHFHLLGRYYDQVESGRKTVEVRVATPAKAAVEVGDAIIFHDRDSSRELDIVVKRVTPYATFEELLDAEDPSRIDPDAQRMELLVTLRSIYPPDREALSPLAFEFDHRPARPGHSLPMAPSQYAQTVPHHTVYGCLYVRDEHNRPVQLRSVYGSRLWQFPGGNLDTQGEDPLKTAHREAIEETGLEIGPKAPKLLLTHFLHAGPRLPLNKVGFIFDGGRLTTDQLRQIRLDPAEHDMWAVHDLEGWRPLMSPEAFARLDAVERARLGEGPAYLITHT